MDHRGIHMPLSRGITIEYGYPYRFLQIPSYGKVLMKKDGDEYPNLGMGRRADNVECP